MNLNRDEIRDIEITIRNLQLRRDRLRNEELCDHHYNGSDRCYECYCSGCGKHVQEVTNAHNIPFKIDTYCYQCKKTPEEKEIEKQLVAEKIRQSELETLRRLKEKYEKE